MVIICEYSKRFFNYVDKERREEEGRGEERREAEEGTWSGKGIERYETLNVTHSIGPVFHCHRLRSFPTFSIKARQKYFLQDISRVRSFFAGRVGPGGVGWDNPTREV